MATFKDTDELRVFLKRIKTYDEFWDAKEPNFFDADEKLIWDNLIKEGEDIEDILHALKSGEIWRFVEEQKDRKKDKLN